MLTIATPPRPQPTVVRLDFWADLGCPWCYIGSRRLALAVAHEPDGSVLARWRSFQLQPQALSDPSGGTRQPLAPETKERIGAIGREVGIMFRPAALDRSVDTALAQRAVLLFDGQPRQRGAVAALFAAHFEHGLDISRIDTVCEVVFRATGESAVRLRERLLAGEGGTALAADLLEAQVSGVTAAPTYVIEGALAVEGAQEVEVLRSMIAEGRRVGR